MGIKQWLAFLKTSVNVKIMSAAISRKLVRDAKNQVHEFSLALVEEGNYIQAVKSNPFVLAKGSLDSREQNLRRFICQSDGVTAGVVTVKVIPNFADKICYLEVLPSYRGRGVGSFMMKELQSKRQPLTLGCHVELIPFYEKNGFELENKGGQNIMTWPPTRKQATKETVATDEINVVITEEHMNTDETPTIIEDKKMESKPEVLSKYREAEKDLGAAIYHLDDAYEITIGDRKVSFKDLPGLKNFIVGALKAKLESITENS